MRTSFGLFAVLALAACGDADATAEINGAAFAAEEEVGSTSDALLSNAASVWLPMQEGNVWTFRSSSGEERRMSFSDVASGMGWLEGLSRDGQWAGHASSAPNTLFVWNSAGQRWEGLFRFGYQYTSWTVGDACDKATARRTATDANVTVPAGSFTGARTIGFAHAPPPNARCMAPLFTSVTFAPSVGVVSFVSGLGETFRLVSAKVNGKTYPQVSNTLRSTLQFDKVSYVNKSNTIRCITTPCPGNGETAVAKFVYTVTNGTAQSQTWQFSSGCQFDLALSSTSGARLRSYMEDRACTLALTNFTLAPGQSRSFNGSLELAAVDGTQLEGRLTAKAFLIPRGGASAGPAVPASAELTVSIVPATP